MRNNAVEKINNVVLVDPNLVNVNTNQINPIPEYETMHIQADLIAKRKGRTVLNSGGNSTTEETITVNLMGFNQNSKNPNFENFTTNYYDGSTGNETQYESFGITSIKTSINSSFIPEVEIEFVDIRGLSFFNQNSEKETSPYRILFDFPPPLFELTIKGYYGKALRYKLHLVSYTSDFNSSNGNFVINAKFVAITFAPLADVLFRYIVNFPLIDSGSEYSPEQTTFPKNTNELALKTRNLITATEKYKSESFDKINYDNIVEAGNAYTEAMTFIAGSRNSSKLENISEPAIFFIKNKNESPDLSEVSNADTNTLTKIENIYDYNDLIIRKQVVGVPVNMDERIYVGFVIGETATNSQHPIYDESRVNAFINALNELRTELIDNTVSKIGGNRETINTKIKLADILESTHNFDGELENLVARYAVLDLTDIYLHLHTLIYKNNNEKNEIIETLNEKINELVLKNLGMMPTIYNIFKVILDDVDTFFEKLRNTSIAADNHHNQSGAKSVILGSNFRDVGDEISKIYPFPLVIRNKTQCGRLVEERIAPIDISKSMASSFGEFPELTLVNKFINTFRRQNELDQQLNMLNERNADGTYLWIPISPFNSTLATINVTTPYIGIDSSGGGSESSPIPITSDIRLNAIFKILIERIIVLTQYVLPLKFISSQEKDRKLILLHAKAEAINLAVSIFNDDLRSNLKIISNKYKSNPNEFIEYIQTNLPEYYDGVGSGGNDYLNIGGTPIYINKNNDNYVGCKIFNHNLDLTEVVINTAGNSETSPIPIDRFRSEIKTSDLKRIVFGTINSEEYVGYVEENLFHIRDGVGDNNRNSSGDEIIKTRFCIDYKELNLSENYKKNMYERIINYDETSKRYGGNSSINMSTTANSLKLKSFTDVMDVWVKTFADGNDAEIIYNKVFKYDNNPNFNTKVSSIILLSNFGYTASPFNSAIQGIYDTIFNIPSVVNVPKFLPLYIGALVDVEKDDETYNELYDFFFTGDGKNIKSNGFLIFADIFDVKQRLSKKDKKAFKILYDTWFKDGKIDSSGSTIGSYSEIIVNMNEMFKVYLDDIPTNGILLPDVLARRKRFKELLSYNGDYYPRTLGQLMTDNYILNYSELTFNYNDLSKETYTPFNIMDRTLLNRMITQFFTKLNTEIPKVEERDTETRENFDELSSDEDIVTQTYYSFKNINDKWLVETQNSGYPFITGGKKLIDLFAFVDRGMNPVGDTIINPEAIIELVEDTDASVFTVLSTLLSNNGFEFFPLQNFMSIDFDKTRETDEWTESFKINTSGSAKIQDNPFFVCMYIGGFSRMISGIERFGNFKDDGIMDLSNTDSGYFSTNECSPQTDRDRQVELNQSFPWGQVRAFRVRFGEQNQSMFKDIKINSKEFPETNESIQILSRLAGDNRANAPIPKGQNLYNLYENRAYSATITGLGNAMIQPTQYFQLENVPLYNGAYLILNVEHVIEPNKMTTTFSGTKILKYPIPRVTNPAAIFGFDGGDTDLTNSNMASNDGIIGIGSSGNPDTAKYNSMYTQQILE